MKREQYQIVPAVNDTTPDRGLPARPHVSSLCRPVRVVVDGEEVQVCGGGACCDTRTVTVSR